MAKQNKPAIRFKGFTDAWEQRKLGEILQERNTRTSDFESNPLYSLTIESGVTPKTDRYERSSLVTKTEDLFKTVKPNEFVTNPMNLRFGALGYNKNAFTVSVSGYYDVFSIDDDKCSGFWNAYFKTPTAMNIFDNAATGSLIEKRRVKYSTLQQLAFYMPNDLSEKAEIGKYMDTFDHLITLHQRKFDKLQVLKKAMLEKMFPKNGSSVPEIRFKGFTDAWEQRKLGEILQERNTRTSDFESNPLYSLTIESGVTPKTDRYERSSLVTKTEDLFKTVKPNEFVTNPMNLRFGALGYNKNAFTVSVSGYYDVFSIDDDKCSGFWNAYFKTPTAMNIFDNAATGSLIEKRRVKYSTLQQLAFYMPNDLSEKAEIGKYMDTFDHLITLHQRELEKLQNIKKSMLEKMFV